MNDLERFLAKVSPEPNSGCWLWSGHVLPNGYGQFRFRGVANLAHRVGYQLLRGAVPDGLQLDHLCRVRCCVNPDHLEPVTRVENVRRGDSGKIGKAKTHCPNGHPYTPENVYLWHGSRHCRQCRRPRRRPPLTNAQRREISLRSWDTRRKKFGNRGFANPPGILTKPRDEWHRRSETEECTCEVSGDRKDGRCEYCQSIKVPRVIEVQEVGDGSAPF